MEITTHLNVLTELLWKSYEQYEALADYHYIEATKHDDLAEEYQAVVDRLRSCMTKLVKRGELTRVAPGCFRWYRPS